MNRKKRKYKNRMGACLLAILLCTAAAAGMLGGCGGKELKEGGSGAKGRYVEQDMEFPKQEGEEVLNLSNSKEGNPVLYTASTENRIFRYEYREDKWERTSFDWVQTISEEKEIYFQEVQETAEGIQYVRGVDEDMAPVLIRSRDGQKGEKLAISWLTKESEFGYPGVTNLQIDGKGNLWMNDLYQSKFVVISADSLEVLKEISSVQGFFSEQKMLYRTEDGNMAANTDEGIYTIFDSDLNEIGQLSLPAQGIYGICSKGDEWYEVSEEGITRRIPGNETSERLLEGSMGAMGSSVNIVAGITAGKEKDFYVLYRQEKAGSVSLKRYVYDADAPVQTEHTLKVFGLAQNQTIQDAISGFQKAHPDTRVEYQFAGEEAGVSADDIRTLNTELLSGNGADVLLLDGLPAGAYIEKGVLADLTDLKKELTKESSYLDAMLENTLQEDGKIYGMPVKFAVPIMYGNEESMDALSSLENLGAYVSEHPDASIFGLADKEYIRDFLFQLYQEELFTGDGKICRETLTELFELQKTIAVNAKAGIFDEAARTEVAMGTAAGIFRQGMFINQGSASILNHPEGAATNQIDSVQGMMIPYAVMREKNLTPETVRDFYCPVGVVGINENSDQKKLAGEFIRYLFSEEVQGTPLDDGLPVMVSELEKKKAEVDSDYAREYNAMSSWQFEEEETILINAGYPLAEEVEELISMCKGLKNPAMQDAALWNIYQTQADACLEGRIDAETAAKNVAQKLDTYLSE